jgi:hypothetical protein
MISRFQIVASEAESPAPELETRPPECPCCAAIRRAREISCFDPLPEWHSPLTPGVQLVNLSHTEDGTELRVDLARDWARMFAQLPEMGGGLVLTRNAGAMLGRRMRYPALTVTSGGSKAANGEEGVWLDFRRLGSARAGHRRLEAGHLFGVEFADCEGRMAHRFNLTARSRLDEFFAWVRLHQACSACPPVPARPEEQLAPPMAPRALRACGAGVLGALVTACMEHQVPLRATVSGPAARQRAEFTPRALQPCDPWWYVSDDETGLHFEPARFGKVMLEEHAGEVGSRFALRAATAEGGDALLLEAVSFGAEETWHRLIESAAHA